MANGEQIVAFYGALPAGGQPPWSVIAHSRLAVTLDDGCQFFGRRFALSDCLVNANSLLAIATFKRRMSSKLKQRF